MNCPKCEATLNVDLVFTGGCQGHGPDENCYCDSPDVHIELYCYDLKGKGYCNYHERRVPGLTDKYAIERWIEARLSVEDLAT